MGEWVEEQPHRGKGEGEEGGWDGGLWRGHREGLYHLKCKGIK